MASICFHCLKQPITPPHRYYCSTKCMNAASRAKRAKQVMDLRFKIAQSGYDAVSERLFAEAEATLLVADHRAWHYRLMLDLVGGKPSRVRPDSRRALKDYRCVTFPEPHRASHRDCDGLRRIGDYFVLRSPFERPAVPLAGYYRVQLLGFVVMGEPLPLQPLSEATTDLSVNLPASPFSDKWRSRSWGSEDIPEHRARQAQRRREQKDARAAELRRVADTPEPNRPSDPEGKDE